jgi:hypothetical protein
VGFCLQTRRGGGGVQWMEEPTKKMEAETGADGVSTPREPAPPARAAVRNFRGAPRALAIACGPGDAACVGQGK